MRLNDKKELKTPTRNIIAILELLLPARYLTASITDKTLTSGVRVCLQVISHVKMDLCLFNLCSSYYDDHRETCKLRTMTIY
jgi:hypothetical protein